MIHEENFIMNITCSIRVYRPYGNGEKLPEKEIPNLELKWDLGPWKSHLEWPLSPWSTASHWHKLPGLCHISHSIYPFLLYTSSLFWPLLSRAEPFRCCFGQRCSLSHSLPYKQGRSLWLDTGLSKRRYIASMMGSQPQIRLNKNLQVAGGLRISH